MSGSMQRLGGRFWIWIDGIQFPVVSQPTYGVATTKKTLLKGLDGIHGYAEEPVPGFIAVTLRDTADVSMSEFDRMTDVSVSAQLANGKRVSGNNMVCVETVEVDATEGTFSVRFEGEDVTDQ
ncbi:hypothetical protein HMPREF9946_03989 [Acetobacteraceae bacterium AT-5844]|nr:hypothetical protein HMPREF9946_03989 [Acetobacteraceae bacterium AT-5844]